MNLEDAVAKAEQEASVKRYSDPEDPFALKKWACDELHKLCQLEMAQSHCNYVDAYHKVVTRRDLPHLKALAAALLA